LRPVDDQWWELLAVLVAEGDLRGRRVLDVGCGTGRLAVALAERGARVWGIDPSEEMLAQARAHSEGKVALKRAAAEALPFKDGWFEAAVFRLVIHLLDRPRAFAETRRILAPGGLIVVASFAPDTLDRFWISRVFPAIVEIDLARFPTEARLRAELAEAGFESVRARRLNQKDRLDRSEALERIRGRYISTLRLLGEEELTEGLARAERELPEVVEDEREWLVVVAEHGHAT
jgi:ubiquinone/menaquinone biosynthesis C-methylase UbiE